MATTTTASVRRPPSEILKSAFHEEAPVNLQNLVHSLGDRSYGLLLLMLSIINLLPAANVIFGLTAAGVGLQLAAQRGQPWLPKRILDIELSANTVRQFNQRLLPKIRSSEDWLKPRWPWTEAAWVGRLAGLTIFALGLIIALPLPFTNALPAVVSVFIALGLLYRDGMVLTLSLAVGWLVTALMVHFVSAISSAIGQHFF